MNEPSERSVPGEGELGLDRMAGPTRWAFLTGDRRVLALALLVGLGVLLGGLLWTGVVAVANESSITRLFSAFIGGNLTLITVVITINQLILSREFGTPGELRDRIAEVAEYRHEVEETAGTAVSPVTPQAFLAFLADQTQRHALAIREERSAVADPAYRDAIDRYTATLVAQSERIDETLDDRAETFDALLTILDTDFTSDRYAAERLHAMADDDVPESIRSGLTDVVALLEYIGAARQYFETIYMQQELADLSRKILFTGIPAVSASLLTVWLYGHPSGATLASPFLEGVVLLAALVALSPLAVLFAYVLRITTVTRRTVSLMPFRTDEMDTA